jgi:hypothetical protein
MSTSQDKVDINELAEALHDTDKGEALMTKMGWTKPQMVQEGQKLIQQLTADVGEVSRV